jgi:hypothetical protein
MNRGLFVACLWIIAASSTTRKDVPAANIIAISEVTLIDGTGAPKRTNQTVLIEGNRITRIPTVPGSSSLNFLNTAYMAP